MVTTLLMTLDTDYEVVGLIGSFIVSVGLVPQLMKVYETKSAIDFSYSFLGLSSLGVGLTVIYGLSENLWPIYIPCSMELVGILLLLVMKLVYDRKTTVESSDERDLHRHLVAKPCKTCSCTCGGVSQTT
jgi:MtN3 and saliva related transmembrane protein